MQSSCNQEQPSQLLNNEKGQQSVLVTKLHCLIFHKIIFIDYQKATDYFKVQSINKTSSILTTKNTIFQSKAVPRHMRQTRGPRATPSSDVYCSAAAHTSLWQRGYPSWRLYWLSGQLCSFPSPWLLQLCHLLSDNCSTILGPNFHSLSLVFSKSVWV